MTIIFGVLKILGIIAAALLLLLIWVIVVPRHFWIEYSKTDGLTVKMNILFFKFGLYPLPIFLNKKEKSASPANLSDSGEKSDNSPTAETKKEKKKAGFTPPGNIEVSFDLIKQIVLSAGEIIKRIFASLKFSDLSFTLPIHAESARDTAKMYGAVSTAFDALIAFLQQYIKIHLKCPLFVPDFAGNFGESIYFYTKITASPIMLLSAGFYSYKQYRKILANGKSKAEKE